MPAPPTDPAATLPPSERSPMVIAWSNEDAAFVVTVPDLLGCVTHGATYAEAAGQGEEAIATWPAAARAWGDPIPVPGPTRSH